MKLIVTGATGFVGREIIRQAVRNPAVTSIIALSRKPVQLPANFGPTSSASKLQSVILEDWESPFPESVKEHVRGADACIWALAITPTKSKEMDFAEVTRVCHDYTIAGLSNMTLLANKPFRFIYTSGITIERDQSKTLPFLSEYRLMRGRTEIAIIDFEAGHTPDVQVVVTKPGFIGGPGRDPPSDAMVKSLFEQFGHEPKVHVSELAAAMIEVCLKGVEKEPLWSDELARIGASVLGEEDYLR